MARNGRSMRAGECLFMGEKRSCSRSSGAFIGPAYHPQSLTAR